MGRHSSLNGEGRREIERGFTLVEAVIVLAVAALIAVVAVPNFYRAKIKGQSNQGLRSVNSLLDRARAEALKRHSPVAVVVNTTNRTFEAFEDWDPANAEVATNNNGKRDGAELRVANLNLDGALRYAHPSGGAVVEFPLNPDGHRYLSYGSDGALVTTGGSAHFADTPNNFFRIRVNAATGAARTEKWLSGTSWTPRREQWVWKY